MWKISGLSKLKGLKPFVPFRLKDRQDRVPAGRIRIPVYDYKGVCRLKVIDIRQADSEIDYSPENRVDYSFLESIDLGDFDGGAGGSSSNVDTSAVENKEYHQESFAGGTYGWFYGAWTGNYPWDENELFKARADENSPDQYTETSTPPPPSFLPLNKNEIEAGNRDY
ncbi:hypothetical protein [Marispirochaeta aestuarii]|uniref:hypothetical protein n=1 Tax=Marispirochaeta aestuarii TaxID=1963862 RepID=UPI0029C9716C|nr:hypothetical protein [Marispirochaeta aestuarii]